MSTKQASIVFRTAFTRGFWKGLASPVAVFEEAPVQKQAPFVVVSVPSLPESPMKAAWSQVGSALSDAVKKHEQASPRAKRAKATS